MSRGGADKDRENGPERKCIATGEVGTVETMIRFVVGPDNQIVPDVLGKLPGRGIWVSSTSEALDKAISKGLFSRAAKTKVTIPDGMAEMVEQQITRRVIDLLSLARKSGLAVAGYEKVKDLLDKEDAYILIQACDGSTRGKSKLSTPHRGKYIGWLTADELGAAFGRETVIHSALGYGGLSNRVVEEATRLKGLRAQDGGMGRREG